jgi:hypothetical protein
VEDSSSFGVLCLQFVFFFYTLVTPLLCLVSLMILLVHPLTVAAQRKVLAVAETANAWSAIEVFALSIVVALLEISTFAALLVGDKCDLINQILEGNLDEELGGFDKCYSVSANVKANVLYLLCGVLLNSFVVSFLLRLVHSALEDRENGDENDFVWFLSQSRFASLIFVPAFETTADDERGEFLKAEVDDAQFWKEWRKVTSVT